MTASEVDLMQAMPLLARNGGEWFGEYVHTDAQGNIVDRHRSHLIPTFTPGSDSYTQTNRYIWSDGREQVYSFIGRYADGAVVYDTERMSGRAWEADASTIVLRFSYKDDPGKVVYEYIHLSDDGQHRSRVWMWFNEQGELYRHTLIKETRTGG